MASTRNKTTTTSHLQAEEKLEAAELGRFLKKVAAAHKDPKLGNRALYRSLSDLAEALIKSGHVDPAHAIKGVRERNFPAPAPSDYTKLSRNAVHDLIRQGQPLKKELVELGAQRFGIARSRLARLPREEIIQAISSAADHEESLEVLSEEAKRSGAQRFS
ncbi:hypothetical protein [Caenispirillum salinarum]|uniref:hypothetical protein n=1 Tax=Caenispirillum salinarum TaxID=859058 RepID=UPI00384B2F22